MKQTIIATLFTIFSFSAIAQSMNVQYGLKAGLNVSTLSGEGAGYMYNHNAWYAGVQATFPLSKVIAFQPELLYSKEGFRGPGVIYRCDYARLPFTFQARHQSGVYAELGAQVGVNLKGTAEIISQDQKMDIPELEQINTALIMGFGYRHAKGFGANFRYSPSVSNLGNEIKAKLNCLSVGVFYTLESLKK